jgi:hypothetical protein
MIAPDKHIATAIRDPQVARSLCMFLMPKARASVLQTSVSHEMMRMSPVHQQVDNEED